jgi:hypothetical protein
MLPWRGGSWQKRGLKAEHVWVPGGTTFRMVKPGTAVQSPGLSGGLQQHFSA